MSGTRLPPHSESLRPEAAAPTWAQPLPVGRSPASISFLFTDRFDVQLTEVIVPVRSRAATVKPPVRWGAWEVHRIGVAWRSKVSSLPMEDTPVWMHAEASYTIRRSADEPADREAFREETSHP
jgi:hypothetical protein